MNKKLVLSVFNTVLKTYSSRLLVTKKWYTNTNSCNKRRVFLLNNTLSNINMSTSSNQADGIVSYEELKKVCDGTIKNVLIIDVREPKELRETGVLPGSVNIPLGEVENALKNLSEEEFAKEYGIPKPCENSSLIFSCRSGRRSAMAQELSKQLGFTNVKNYVGGWLEWEKKSN